jgi:hypothetical protein
VFERSIGQYPRLLKAAVAATLLTSCGSDSPTGPVTVSAQVSLAPGAFAVLAGSQISGAVEFPAAGNTGAEYLVVGQFASTTEATTTFTLGASLTAALPAAPRPAPSVAQGFHDMLRQREAEMAQVAPMYRPLFKAPPQRTSPPTVGSKRTFKVCGTIACTATVNVSATAQFVGAHAAIFVDDSAPAGGFNATDIAQVGAQFDQVLWPIDNARFGAESDIDANGVVVVLLTRQLNALVPSPACNTSFITGYFFGGDIAPGFATTYNNGEVFYGMVPDPAGMASCPYSTAFVKRIIPVTFIHEFQHMISFNQHVLVRGGSQEVLWLNEGMSHLAEELGGLHYDSAGVDTTASRFFQGDFYNASIWMTDPPNNAMVTETPPGSLEERGAEWIFLRYVMDQFGPTTSRTLEQTSLTGAANLQAATGTTFNTLLANWVLALFLSDYPGFTAPAALKYSTWSFRSTYAQLHGQDPGNFPRIFPLQPDSAQGSAALASGSLGAGSGAYIIATQPAGGAGFQLVFRGQNGGVVSSANSPQLAIARIH